MEKRFYVDFDISSVSHFVLSGDEFLHMTKVMRLRVGDTVECFFDGSDVYECKIADIKKQEATLTVLSKKECHANPNVYLTLFQALPKLDKLEYATQKLCEIGATRIVPFLSKFCVAKANENKIERLKKIVISACKQSKRTKLLEVDDTKSFDKMIDMLSGFDLVVFANEKESPERTDVLRQKISKLSNMTDKKVACIVGSEGGFDDSEIDVISRQKNVISISLGRRILRAETASVVVPTIVLYELNEI